jgi:ribosome-associated toxin RatA of RatAB toxin-antitoxin module
VAQFKFSLNLIADKKDLIDLATNYESYSEYLPAQLKEIKILEKNESVVITQETLVLSSIFKKEFKQDARHEQISENELITEILSGPAKGSMVNIEFLDESPGTKINVSIDLKLDLKSKILLPIIKKYYKIILTAILYKMNTKAITAKEKT